MPCPCRYVYYVHITFHMKTNITKILLKIRFAMFRRQSYSMIYFCVSFLLLHRNLKVKISNIRGVHCTMIDLGFEKRCGQAHPVSILRGGVDTLLIPPPPLHAIVIYDEVISCIDACLNQNKNLNG